jgi:rubredoxin
MIIARLARKQNTDKRKEVKRMAKPEEMYQCQTVNCGCLYDPNRGDRRGKVPKGVCFKDLPEDWKCPVCGAGKKMFKSLCEEKS